MKEERLLQALDHIDDKYLEEIESSDKKFAQKLRFSTKKIIALAASFAIMIALSLYLFLPYKTEIVGLSAYKSSEYFPLIEQIAEYTYTPPRWKNNFQYFSYLLNTSVSVTEKDGAGMDHGNSAPTDSAVGGSSNNISNSANGSYIENTDNQVDGVIESDIVKMTDKYIFRIVSDGLAIYKMKGEQSLRTTLFTLPVFDDERSSYISNFEMYLSDDGNTITLVKPYVAQTYLSKLGVISLDVSNVYNVQVKAKFTIDGAYHSSRMVDGTLLLISEYRFDIRTVDYTRPETYVPTIDRGNGKECIKFENILLPDSMSNTRYSIVSLLNESNLELLGANALLNFDENIYVSENNIFITREYTDKKEEDGYRHTKNMSDIAVIGYTENKLEQKGIITVDGIVKNQYSMDEKDGYLRLVTTATVNVVRTQSNGNATSSTVSSGRNTDVSLYVFNLSDNSLTAKVYDFAPEGETAESVRFDGDTAYVCTAIVVLNTDPVYFFDLSDYSNITYTDTGEIDGYSTSLIDIGNGFLLGIGVEDSYNKVSIYEETLTKVEEVDRFIFTGSYSKEYKSYYIDRERGLFGFFVTNMRTPTNRWDTLTGFILLHFNGYDIEEVARIEFADNTSFNRNRAVYYNGYFYITGDNSFKPYNFDYIN